MNRLAPYNRPPACCSGRSNRRSAGHDQPGPPGGCWESNLMKGTLVFIIGPPAVGKMTVGLELSALTGIPLFHNHHSIEAVLPVFDFGTEPFNRLVSGFRDRMFIEVAESEFPGPWRNSSRSISACRSGKVQPLTVMSEGPERPLDTRLP